MTTQPTPEKAPYFPAIYLHRRLQRARQRRVDEGFPAERVDVSRALRGRGWGYHLIVRARVAVSRKNWRHPAILVPAELVAILPPNQTIRQAEASLLIVAHRIAVSSKKTRWQLATSAGTLALARLGTADVVWSLK